MKGRIDGVLYDTERATHLCVVPCCPPLGQAAYRHETTLYWQLEVGFFLAGHGGRYTLWTMREPNGDLRGSHGLVPVDAEEARAIMEAFDCTEDQFAEVGFAVEVA